VGGGGGATGGRGPRVGSAPAERSNDGVERNGIAGDLPLGAGPGSDRAWTQGAPAGGSPSLRRPVASVCLLASRWGLGTLWVGVSVMANA
jgi:hypothetical protein